VGSTKHKRKYYRFDGESSRTTDLVLVKWIEEGSIKISSPIKDYNKALSKCQSYLQKGICSWMVYYDG
tara:strand:- start:365 stop:568 length:204 start_codon:yes stop_codon:yes gene_type:complete